MKGFFQFLYKWLLSKDLYDYFLGYDPKTEEFTGTPWYKWILIMLILAPVIIALMYYFVNFWIFNHPRYNRFKFWLEIGLGGIFILNFLFLILPLLFSDYSIIVKNIGSFIILLFFHLLIYSFLVIYLIFSLILKRFSTNCKYVPF